jgi:hypothetical protein
MESIGLLVTLEARPGKDAEAEAFLKSAQPLALDEKATLKWYAIKLGPGKFGIFDTFANEAGRNAHLTGELAKALGEPASELFAVSPQVEKVAVLANTPLKGWVRRLATRKAFVNRNDKLWRTKWQLRRNKWKSHKRTELLWSQLTPSIQHPRRSLSRRSAAWCTVSAQRFLRARSPSVQPALRTPARLETKQPFAPSETALLRLSFRRMPKSEHPYSPNMEPSWRRRVTFCKGASQWWRTSVPRQQAVNGSTQAAFSNYRVRFIKPDVAVADSLLTVRNVNGPDGTIIPVIPINFFFVAARHGDKWLIDDGRAHFAPAPPNGMTARK